AGGKMVVPHQRQAFLKRMEREETAVKPPGFQSLRAARIGRSLPDHRGQRLEIGWDTFKPRVTVEQSGDGRLRPVGQVALQLWPGGGKTGPAMQMNNPLEVPGGGGGRFIGGPSRHKNSYVVRSP